MESAGAMPNRPGFPSKGKIMFLAAICIFAMFQAPEQKGELWDTYQANKEAIDEYAAALGEPASDKEIIEGWEKAQPSTYSGLRDRRRRRRQDRTPQENQEIDDWEEDKPSIWDRRKERRDHRFNRRDKWINIAWGVAIGAFSLVVIVAAIVACVRLWGLKG